MYCVALSAVAALCCLWFCIDVHCPQLLQCHCNKHALPFGHVVVGAYFHQCVLPPRGVCVDSNSAADSAVAAFRCSGSITTMLHLFGRFLHSKHSLIFMLLSVNTDLLHQQWAVDGV
jgi:hypothetical protein